MPTLVELTKQISGAIVAGVTDPTTPASRKAAILGGFTASGVRFATATVIGRLGPRPDKPLVLFDREGDSDCRSVREALSRLDLDAEVRPCPRGGARFTGSVTGGLPRLEDPNVGVTLSGTRPIIDHLYARYGVGRPPWFLDALLVRALSGLPMRLLTGFRGERAVPSKAPAQPLELWSFEASPYCRFVRNLLCELELPYLLHNLSKGSPRRKAYAALSGKMQFPYLHDPNTGRRLHESRDIEQYLRATYGG